MSEARGLRLSEIGSLSHVSDITSRCCSRLVNNLHTITFSTVATTIVAAVAVAAHTTTAKIQTSPIKFKLPPISPLDEIVSVRVGSVG